MIKFQLLKKCFHITWIIFLLLNVTNIVAEEQVKEISVAEAEDRKLIRNLFKDKRYQFAREEAGDYLTLYTEGLFRAEALFIQAQVFVVEKDYKSALDRYAQIIEKYPKSPFNEEALYYGGVLLIQENETEKGKIYLNQLQKTYPTSKHHIKSDYPLGQLAFEQGNWDVAAVHLEKALKIKDMPKVQKLEIKRFLAWTYHFQGRKEQAEKAFIGLLNEDIDKDSKAKICYQLGVEAHKLNNYPKAIFWFEKQMKTWPHPDFQDKSRFWIAESYFSIHQNPEQNISKQDKIKAINLYVDNLNIESPLEPILSYLHRGQLYFSLKYKEKADEDFAYLLTETEAYRNNIELLEIRIDINYELEKWPIAISLMQQLQTLVPVKQTDFWFLINIAKANDQLANPEINKRWKKRYANLANIGFYDNQALQYYESAYYYLPISEKDTKLSLLDILIKKHNKRENYSKVVDYYKDVINYLEDPEKIEAIKLRIAKLYLTHLKNEQQSRNWLFKLHNNADYSYNFEASSMLSNLSIKAKYYHLAMKVLYELSRQPIENTRYHIPTNYRLAELYQMHEKWHKAVKYYTVVAETETDSKYKTQSIKRLNSINAYLMQLKAAEEAKIEAERKRIADAKAAEEAKIEAERKRIADAKAAEAKAKAAAEAKAKAAAEAKAKAAEAKAKAAAEAKAKAAAETTN